jgi:serine/threonine protein kinase
MLRRDASGKKDKYFKQVDWFSFGCLLYEFTYGCSPFRTNIARNWGCPPGTKLKPTATKEERDRCIDMAVLEMEVEYDHVFFKDPNLVSLLKGLLDKDPLTRLGAISSDEIFNHPWFDDIGTIFFFLILFYCFIILIYIILL